MTNAEVLTWELEWKSTPEERYETDMMDKAEAAMLENGIVTLERAGGTDLISGRSDNILLFIGTRTEGRLAMKLVKGAVGHDVTLNNVTDPRG